MTSYRKIVKQKKKELTNVLSEAKMRYKGKQTEALQCKDPK
jgi:thermostable 8-oxoguanine DNA glycosylase